MYVDNYEFKDWMQKLLDKLDEVGKDVKSLQTNPEVMPNDKLLDNQDLCLLFKVSTRTLQRLRSKKLLPFMMISGKAYYRASDVREFIRNVRCGHAPKVRGRTRKRISKSETSSRSCTRGSSGMFFLLVNMYLLFCRYYPLFLIRCFKLFGKRNNLLVRLYQFNSVLFQFVKQSKCFLSAKLE